MALLVAQDIHCIPDQENMNVSVENMQSTTATDVPMRLQRLTTRKYTKY